MNRFAAAQDLWRDWPEINRLGTIERFHSHDHMISIYANLYLQKKTFTWEESSTTTGLVRNTNMATVLLFWTSIRPPWRDLKTFYFGLGRRESEDLDFSQYCNSSNAREFAREEWVAGGKKALSLIRDFQ